MGKILNDERLTQILTGVKSAIEIAVATLASATNTVLNTTLSRGRTANSTIGTGSLAFGSGVTASGDYSYAGGSSTVASGDDAHAEGFNTIASGDDSHAEGQTSEASGQASHAEGVGTIASGAGSHAEGSATDATGMFAHAEGQGTVASNNYMHVSGRYNTTPESDEIFVVGNGTGNNARSNAMTLKNTGDVYFSGDIYAGGDVVATADDLSDVEIKRMLHSEDLDNTVQTITFDQSTGEISQIVHSQNNTAVRTDVFTFGTNTITEVRTLSTGQSLTIVTNTSTFATTITYAAA